MIKIQLPILLALGSLLSACSVTDYEVKTDAHSQFSANGNEVKVEQLLKTSQSWDGANLPAYPNSQPEVTLLKLTIPVGISIDLHKHLMINAAYIIKGDLKVTSVKGDELTLTAGDSIAEMVNSWHKGINIGAEPVEMIVFYAGAKQKPLTIKKSTN